MSQQFTKEECKLIGLYVVTHFDALNFAESADSKSITDPQLLLELRDILQTQYQDGISAIPEARLNADDSFSGVFEDEVSPKLIKRFKFTISADDTIAYKLLNAADVENFTEELEFATAATTKKKKKNCTKGTSCGIGCISATKTCRKAPDAGTKKKTAELRKKVSTGVGKQEKKTSNGKTTPESITQDFERSLKEVSDLRSSGDKEVAIQIAGAIDRSDALRRSVASGNMQSIADALPEAITKLRESSDNSPVGKFSKATLEYAKLQYDKLPEQFKREWANNQYTGFKKFGKFDQKLYENFANKSSVHQL